MLPQNIQNLIKDLIRSTENNAISWDFDYVNAVAKCSVNGFSVALEHSYNDIDEVRQFNIYINDLNGYNSRFSVSQKFYTYDSVKFLYDIAQANNISIPRF
ncbi:hypothetical protein AB7W46_11785 [Providencia rettgeri]